MTAAEAVIVAAAAVGAERIGLAIGVTVAVTAADLSVASVTSTKRARSATASAHLCQ